MRRRSIKGSLPKGVADGKSEPAAEEAADDVERKISCRRQYIAGADEGQEFHVVRRKGRKTAKDAGYEKELDRRRKVRHLRKEYEEESDAKGSDGIGQDRSVREADGSVTKCQLSDTVAQAEPMPPPRAMKMIFSMIVSL